MHKQRNKSTSSLVGTAGSCWRRSAIAAIEHIEYNTFIVSYTYATPRFKRLFLSFLKACWAHFPVVILTINNNFKHIFLLNIPKYYQHLDTTTQTSAPKQTVCWPSFESLRRFYVQKKCFWKKNEKKFKFDRPPGVNILAPEVRQAEITRYMCLLRMEVRFNWFQP